MVFLKSVSERFPMKELLIVCWIAALAVLIALQFPSRERFNAELADRHARMQAEIDAACGVTR